MKKLIIFDCDGVLVDSEIIFHRITAEMLMHFGYLISAEEHIKKFMGINRDIAKQMIFEESGIILPDDFSINARKRTLSVLEEELRALVLPILKDPDLALVKRAIASNSSKEWVLQALRITKQADFFKEDHVFSATQVKNMKPAPDVFLCAAESMKMQPHECIVIEDSIFGISAARAAGMDVIGFLGGSHTKYDWYKDLVEKQNIPIVHNSKELLEKVKHLTV